jgi:hypothetical protein
MLSWISSPTKWINMRNLAPRSKKLTRPVVRIHNDQITDSSTVFPTVQSCAQFIHYVPYYLAYRTVHNQSLTDEQKRQIKIKGSGVRIFVQCEGTLFSDMKRAKMQTREQFRWADYYNSIRKEPLSVKYLPLLSLLKEGGFHINLLCSTPLEYADAVTSALDRCQLGSFFTSITYKDYGKEPTQMFLFRVMKNAKRQSLGFANGYFISDTHIAPPGIRSLNTDFVV